ncbi:MAG: replicative DNA helicase [Symploca sp. SIO2C1]|nr:replicative DNA helicase [Symploca sp. SIO2C1]
MYSNTNNVISFQTFGDNALPPQNIDAEEAILGGILLDPEAMSRIVDILYPQAFYINVHRNIYEAALALYLVGKPTDLMSVTTFLYDHKTLDKVGGQSKLAQLVERTVSAVNIDRYADLVMDKFTRRQLIKAGNEIVQLGYETSTELENVLDCSEQKIFKLSESTTTNIETPVDIMSRIYKQIGVNEAGLKTEIYDLDKLIGGLKKKKLYVVAGRSGIGKTQLSVWLAHQTAVFQRKPVIFFSAEMDRDELMTRIIARDSGVDSRQIEEGSLQASDYAAILNTVEKAGTVPLWIDDTPGSGLNLMRIRAGIRRATATYGHPGLVILDYLQLLGSEDGRTNRVSELDRLANGCKSIAKEFDVPFLALAQINRSVESQKDKRPTISQLRESGGLEQASDVIMLLYRDEYYNPDTPDQGIAEIIVGKHRGGKTGTVKCLFKPETSQFLSLT